MIDNRRISVKITGESGQGINSIGEVVAKALKECGYYTFGYREYPSLIKGGHAFHQVDFSDRPLNSSSNQVDLMVSFSRVSFHQYLPTLRENGQAIHMLPMLELTEEEKALTTSKNNSVFHLPADEMSVQIGGKAIMANSIMVAALWKILNLPLEPLEKIIKKEFAHKPEAIKSNLACLAAGYDANIENIRPLNVHFTAHPKRQNDALLTGNNLVSIGAVSAGVRAYFAYPMTPSSSILSYLADEYHETNMLVKQLDDEISVAQTALGAMFMGTRALVATSGGGFDLMTESVSLAGITETPFVCVLAQRPGPATGLPTWTAATDLNLAIYAGHGEYPRCVISVSDSNSAYTLIQHAFNIAEKYQIPTILLTDKQIAESLYQMGDLPPAVSIKRSLISNKPDQNPTSSDRYKITDSGISPRWIPGQFEETYVGNSDEHTPDGTVTEDAQISREMNQKRLRKLKTLEEELPEPRILGPQKAKTTIVTWGSPLNALTDALNIWNDNNPKKQVNLLLYEFMYPTKTGELRNLIKNKKKLILVENNEFAQLGALLTQNTGYIFTEKLLKSNGRPFFIEEIYDFLQNNIK